MTVDIKNNGIPVGLGAWIPKEPEIKATTWKDYIPKLESATDSLESSTDSWSTDSFRKTLAIALYGNDLSNTEVEAYFQQAEKVQAEKEALEHAKMYFG